MCFVVFYIFLYITNISTHYASKKPAYMNELKFQRFWLVDVTEDGLYREDSPEKVINPYHKRRGEDHGGTVVKVLCYKSEGRWFDSRWCQWNFSLT